MAVTPALKALMAEKAKAADQEAKAIEAASKGDWRTEYLLGLIDLAADKLNANWDGKSYKPSNLLKITYFVLATSQSKTAEARGERLVLKALERAERA